MRQSGASPGSLSVIHLTITSSTPIWVEGWVGEVVVSPNGKLVNKIVAEGGTDQQFRC